MYFIRRLHSNVFQLTILGLFLQKEVVGKYLNESLDDIASPGKAGSLCCLQSPPPPNMPPQRQGKEAPTVIFEVSAHGGNTAECRKGYKIGGCLVEGGGEGGGSKYDRQLRVLLK